VEDQWVGDTEGTRRYTKRVILEPGDWENLPALEPAAAHLAEQLACLRLIRKELADHTPIIQTIFSPLAQAKNLAGNETLITHLRLYPEAVLKGLQTIAKSTERFVEAALETGIDGIFYAIQHAQASLLTHAEYESFGLLYDLQVMKPAESSWCNLLHLHGKGIYFDLVNRLKFQIVNWHDRETYPSLLEAQSIFARVVCGGLRQDTLVYGNQDQVRKEAEDALMQTKSQRFMLGTGCVVPIIASHGNIMAARQSVVREPGK
jgi:uroporphyrinogen decarboxylase